MMYAKCGNMEKARCVFDGIVEKDIVTWSTMIQTYALNGFPKEALDLFYFYFLINLAEMNVISVFLSILML